METLTVKGLAAKIGKSERQTRRDILAGKIACDWRRGPKNTVLLVPNEKLAALVEKLGSNRDKELLRSELIRKIFNKLTDLETVRKINAQSVGVVFGDSDGKVATRVSSVSSIGKDLASLRKLYPYGSAWAALFESGKIPIAQSTAYEYMRISKMYPKGFTRKDIAEFRRRVVSYRKVKRRDKRPSGTFRREMGQIFHIATWSADGRKFLQKQGPVAKWTPAMKQCFMDDVEWIVQAYVDCGGRVPRPTGAFLLEAVGD
jgi:hypothetical protein